MANCCIVFEDQFVDRLRPMNLARATCGITCGAYRLMDLLTDFHGQIQYHVRPHLHAVMERGGRTMAQSAPGPVLYLNAALVPDLKVLARIFELAKANEPFLALNDQRVTAALCPADFPSELSQKSGSELIAYLLGSRLPILEDEFPTLNHTFDVIKHHEKLLTDHLWHFRERGQLRTLADNVFAGKNCEIASNVVFDTDDGPIILGDNIRIRPFSYLSGPVKIGDNCLIIDHAAIKHGTVLGHTVKAGGEVESAIIEPYSNKQHHGFLGHAYVGSWVNLGAGTSNSDLKNTYGEIEVEFDNKKISTGLQFLGCVIGDYTKSAINTSILTGKVIGVSSYLYGFVSTNVASFTNYARSFGQVTEVSLEVALKTQTRAAARRNYAMSAADNQLMTDLFELTRTERQLSSEQVVL